MVADFEGAQPALRGFYLQDSGDGDAATSDGTFVFNNNDNDVTNGDVVEVTGPASEFQGQTQVGPAAPGVSLCGGTGTVPPTDVTLPVANATALEPVEGMLTRFPQDTAAVAALQSANNLNRLIVDDASQAQTPTRSSSAGAASRSRRRTPCAGATP